MFTTTREPLPTGRPLVLYLPTDLDLGDAAQLDVARHASAPSEGGYVVDRWSTRESSGETHVMNPTVDGQRCLSVWWARDGGLVTVGPGARAADGTELNVPGFHVDLDWNGCNRLIRFVRTARDQAFGRPE